MFRHEAVEMAMDPVGSEAAVDGPDMVGSDLHQLFFLGRHDDVDLGNPIIG